MTTQKIQNLIDEELVAQFQVTGDNRFFAEIYTRYYKKVFNTCIGIVKDRDVAHDLAQDVMVKAVESLPSLQNGFLLGFWLYKIAKNRSIDYCKNCTSNRFVNTDVCFDLADKGADMESLVAKENLLDSVQHTMGKLKEDDRNLLTLKYFENCSVVDLQNYFALSESAVKMRLVRARKRLFNFYQREQLVALYI
jgi:RNA polymerase sigma-70 factor (ECF subfamily)